MADANEKVYYPKEIDDTPFPGHEGEALFGSEARPGQEIYSPKTTTDTSFPDKKIAVELIGSALNTRSRKILAEFEFSRFGALQIGVYENGVSGDIRISPNGFVARNRSGLTTVAVDGETGDAIFAGTLRAGTIIGGLIIVGNNTWTIDGDSSRPQLLLWSEGLPTILIGEP